MARLKKPPAQARPLDSASPVKRTDDPYHLEPQDVDENRKDAHVVAVVPYRVDVKPSLASKKRKRGQATPGRPRTDSLGTNPYGDHLEINYSVRKTGKDTVPWNELKSYTVFTGKLDYPYRKQMAKLTKLSYAVQDQPFRVGQVVWVRPADVDIESDQDDASDQFWVAHVQACRAPSSTTRKNPGGTPTSREVYLLVYWLYRPNILPTPRDTPPEQPPDIPGEVIPSNFLDIISAETVDGAITSLEYLSHDQVYDQDREFVELMWYRTLDVHSYRKNTEIPTLCAQCKRHDLIERGSMTECEACGQCTHTQCLIQNAKESAEGRYKRASPETEATIEVTTPQKSPRQQAKSTSFSLSRLWGGAKSKTDPEKATKPETTPRTSPRKPPAASPEMAEATASQTLPNATTPKETPVSTPKKTPVASPMKTSATTPKRESQQQTPVQIPDEDAQAHMPKFIVELDAKSAKQHPQIRISWEEAGGGAKSETVAATCPSCAKAY
ncbi:MAG: hypothetical protein M1828_005344 [Chrysothrix sp. TS-e1954]|nr:MAG: hypothetical protein M1828_005344 [Chrysothrix sp. TS-e1954]